MSAWVDYEDLDLSSVAKALSHLGSIVAGVSKGLAKPGNLSDRADCVSDTRYYAQEAVELSALLDRRYAFPNLEDARQFIEVGTIARPRLVGKLWRLLGEVQLYTGAGE